MRSVGRREAFALDELHVALVDERSGVDQAVSSIARETAVRDLAQLGVEQLKDPVEGLAAALARAADERCYFSHRSERARQCHEASIL
ncbi:MAG: hypothetical protein ABIZ18_13430 [Caldimonas sp.]